MIDEFKVGDELYFLEHNYGSSTPVIETIVKITPSGRLKTASYEVEPDLKVRGGRPHQGCWILCKGKPTEELKALFLRRALIRNATAAARKINLDNLNDKDLRSIIDIYQRSKGDKNEPTSQND